MIFLKLFFTRFFFTPKGLFSLLSNVATMSIIEIGKGIHHSARLLGTIIFFAMGKPAFFFLQRSSSSFFCNQR